MENNVKITGVLHFIEGEKEQVSRMGKYVAFAVKQDTPWEDGNVRHDFLLMRAFGSTEQAWVLAHEEGTPVRVEGKLRSSAGSGEMYIQVDTIEEVKD
ncbi:MAG: DNA-binding protein [Aminobacterium sp.]|uniref:Single-stranded DNA-binding protein n=1 Tax=bioreactor metagenome TaxID=1076179 RepID=A0A645EML7_9ZZZZ|nr:MULTISPECIES: DNA-binding protein [unclassified Aminobacterium]MDD4551063.1 DNA-binding protein [Aminobacterium sp.]WMI71474.1 DNA-binding protein [Aminobacterium sp. MB27-C1]WMI71517.1 DNA-binding protein [Aminobacterium sp. MB27-C1]